MPWETIQMYSLATAGINNHYDFFEQCVIFSPSALTHFISLIKDGELEAFLGATDPKKIDSKMLAALKELDEEKKRIICGIAGADFFDRLFQETDCAFPVFLSKLAENPVAALEFIKEVSPSEHAKYLKKILPEVFKTHIKNFDALRKFLENLGNEKDLASSLIDEQILVFINYDIDLKCFIKCSLFTKEKIETILSKIKLEDLAEKINELETLLLVLPYITSKEKQINLFALFEVNNQNIIYNEHFNNYIKKFPETIQFYLLGKLKPKAIIELLSIYSQKVLWDDSDIRIINLLLTHPRSTSIIKLSAFNYSSWLFPAGLLADGGILFERLLADSSVNPVTLSSGVKIQGLTIDRYLNIGNRSNTIPEETVFEHTTLYELAEMVAFPRSTTKADIAKHKVDKPELPENINLLEIVGSVLGLKPLREGMVVPFIDQRMTLWELVSVYFDMDTVQPNFSDMRFNPFMILDALINYVIYEKKPAAPLTNAELKNRMKRWRTAVEKRTETNNKYTILFNSETVNTGVDSSSIEATSEDMFTVYHDSKIRPFSTLSKEERYALFKGIKKSSFIPLDLIDIESAFVAEGYVLHLTEEYTYRLGGMINYLSTFFSNDEDAKILISLKEFQQKIIRGTVEHAERKMVERAFNTAVEVLIKLEELCSIIIRTKDTDAIKAAFASRYDQLTECSEGVIYALELIIFELSKSSLIAHHLKTMIETTTALYGRIFGIPPSHEVHQSTHRISLKAGVNPISIGNYKQDFVLHRQDWEPSYINGAAQFLRTLLDRNEIMRLITEDFYQKLIFSESTDTRYQIFSTHKHEFSHLIEVLVKAGIITKEGAVEQTLQFCFGLSPEEIGDIACAPDPTTFELTFKLSDECKEQIQKYAEQIVQEYFPKESFIDSNIKQVWDLLTSKKLSTTASEEGKYPSYDFLWILLLTPDCLALIKKALEAHIEELDEINLNILFYTHPETQTNLFQILISDPIIGLPLLTGFEIKLNDSKEAETPKFSLVARADSSIWGILNRMPPDDASKLALRAIVMKGATLFTLTQLLKNFADTDDKTKKEYLMIEAFILERDQFKILLHGLYKYDNFLALIIDMAKRGKEEQKDFALNKLKEYASSYLREQMYFEYWSLVFATTAAGLTGFIPDLTLSENIDLLFNLNNCMEIVFSLLTSDQYEAILERLESLINQWEKVLSETGTTDTMANKKSYEEAIERARQIMNAFDNYKKILTSPSIKITAKITKEEDIPISIINGLIKKLKSTSSLSKEECLKYWELINELEVLKLGEDLLSSLTNEELFILLLHLPTSNEKCKKLVIESFKKIASPKALLTLLESKDTELAKEGQLISNVTRKKIRELHELLYSATEYNLSSKVVVSLDLDGCVAHGGLTGEIKEGEFFVAKGRDAWVGNTLSYYAQALCRKNLMLFECIRNAIKDKKEYCIMSGSTRISPKIDQKNWFKHPLMGGGYDYLDDVKRILFVMYPSLVLLLQIVAVALSMPLDRFLLGDSLNNQPDGTYFDWIENSIPPEVRKILVSAKFSKEHGLTFTSEETALDPKLGELHLAMLKNMEKEENGAKHKDEIPRDESKFILLFVQMHRAALLAPTDQIKFMFFDDRSDILENVITVFTKYPELIPSNIILEVYHYDGEKPQKQLVIHGTGTAHPDYKKVANDFFKALKVESDKDDQIFDGAAYVLSHGISDLLLLPEESVCSVTTAPDVRRDTAASTWKSILDQRVNIEAAIMGITLPKLPNLTNPDNFKLLLDLSHPENLKTVFPLYPIEQWPLVLLRIDSLIKTEGISVEITEKLTLIKRELTMYLSASVGDDSGSVACVLSRAIVPGFLPAPEGITSPTIATPDATGGATASTTTSTLGDNTTVVPFMMIFPPVTDAKDRMNDVD